jgi:DNA polymerase III subunit epsilon
MARSKHPGQRNSLDALCQRYEVDNSQRDLHGALLDAEILADVYLTMTGDRQPCNCRIPAATRTARTETIVRLSGKREPLPVIEATAEELAAHEALLEAIASASRGSVLWRRAATPESTAH